MALHEQHTYSALDVLHRLAAVSPGPLGAMNSPDAGTRCYGAAQTLGARDSQEDRLVAMPSVGAQLSLPTMVPVGYFAVFDGHLGWSAAEFAQQHLLSNIMRHPSLCTEPCEAIRAGFRLTDQQYIGSPPPADQLAQLAYVAGTTVAAVLIDFARRRMLVANVGDSRVVLCRAGVAVPLTRDHTCSMLTEDEKAAIAATRTAAVIGTHMWVTVPCGAPAASTTAAATTGSAGTDGCTTPRKNAAMAAKQRFGGSSVSLEVTRALGDPLFKRPYNPTLAACGTLDRDLVSNVPDVVDATLDDACEFVVLATDGLFNCFTNDEVVALAREYARDSPQEAANRLVQAARERQCSDNVSVVVFRCCPC